MLALPQGIIASRHRGSVYDFTSSLKAYYPLNEVSGARYDAFGSHHLTDNNTVGSNTGKSGNAAAFNGADQEYLSVAHHADFSPGAGSFSVVWWAYPTASSGSQGLYSKWADNTNKEHCCYIGLAGARVPSFIISNNGNSDNQLNWGAALTQNAWSMIACVYDYATTTMKISVNAGTFATKTHTGGVASVPTPQPFRIGKDQSTVNGFNGRLDEFAFYKGRAFSQAEVTDYYNSSAGRFYPSY